MNVLIDALSVTRQKAGAGVYAKNLIDELIRIESEIHWFLLVQDDDPDLDYGERTNVTMIRMNSRFLRSIPLRLLFEQAVLPAILLLRRIHVLHSLHYSFPILRWQTRRIVTLHDMTALSMPQAHIPCKVLYFRFFIRAAVALADGIVFVSESARRDCCNLVGIPRGKVAVVYHGKNEAFRPDVPRERMERVRERYNLPEKYLLYVGTIEPRKNLTALVRAFALVAQRHASVHLAIAGKKGWNGEYEAVMDTVLRLGLSGRVIFPGFVAEEDKPALLARSAVFVYPSLYEGFGLPVLEAMASGVPTVTSATSSLPEVAGRGAVLINPNSVEEMASAIDSLLLNPTQREELSLRAIAQALKFSWQKSASMTLAFYRAVVS